VSEPLVCPRCAERHPLDERFCRSCGMPLVFAGVEVEEPLDDLVVRARKIKPQLAEGDLVRVAGARSQADGEFLQGLLLEEGVPSILRRARGFDVPDFLAAGPRDVMVPQSGVATARDVLLQSELADDRAPAGPDPRKLALGLLAAIALVALVVFLGTLL
jgi:hypothetical protein